MKLTTLTTQHSNLAQCFSYNHQIIAKSLSAFYTAHVHACISTKFITAKAIVSVHITYDLIISLPL